MQNSLGNSCRTPWETAVRASRGIYVATTVATGCRTFQDGFMQCQNYNEEKQIQNSDDFQQVFNLGSYDTPNFRSNQWCWVITRTFFIVWVYRLWGKKSRKELVRRKKEKARHDRENKQQQSWKSKKMNFKVLGYSNYM